MKEIFMDEKNVFKLVKILMRKRKWKRKILSGRTARTRMTTMGMTMTVKRRATAKWSWDSEDARKGRRLRSWRWRR